MFLLIKNESSGIEEERLDTSRLYYCEYPGIHL